MIWLFLGTLGFAEETKEEQWEQLFGQCQSLYSEQKTQAGIVAGKKAMALAQKHHGPDSTQHIESRICLSVHLFGQKDAQQFISDSMLLAETLEFDRVHSLISFDYMVVLYAAQERYKKIEPLLLQLLNARAKILGEEHPHTLSTIENILMLYTRQERDVEREPFVIRAIALSEIIRGEIHPQTLSLQNDLVTLYFDQARFKAAGERLVQLIQKRETHFGAEHPHTLLAVNTLGLAYQNQGMYDAAEPLYLRALKTREKVLGVEHPDTLTSLNNLATLYESQGRYQDAEPLYLRALKTREKVLGSDHYETSQSVNNLGSLYLAQGRYSKAETLFEQNLALSQKMVGKDHPATLIPMNNLASSYLEQGKYTEAQQLYEQALDIGIKIFGPENPQTLFFTSNLALVLAYQEQHDKAETLYIQALKGRESVLGAEHPDTLTSLNNLAMLYLAQGRYTAAEERLKQELKSTQKTLGKEHPSTLRALNNLATVYLEAGLLQKAESILLQALDLHTKILGKQHPSTLFSQNNLAMLYLQQKQYKKAENSFRHIVNIREKTLGKQHPDTLFSQNNLAFVFFKSGKYRKAERLLTRTLQSQEKTIGRVHPHTIQSMNNLANIYAAQKKYTKTLALLHKELHAEEAIIRSRFQSIHAAEQDKFSFYDNVIDQTLYDIVQLHIHHLPTNSEAAHLALETLFRRKGRILDAQNSMLSALQEHRSPQIRSLFSQWQETLREHAYLSLNPPIGPSATEYQQARKRLKEKEQQLERELAKKSAAFQKITQSITVGNIQNQLPRDTALIEFTLYQDRANLSSLQYAAVILTPKGQVQWASLGTASHIDQQVTEFRKHLSQQKSYTTMGTELYRTLLQPLEEMLNPYPKVLISPDGQLNLLPFETLIDQKNRHLVEYKQISYLSSGRDILHRNTKTLTRSPPIILAFPDYGESLRKATEKTGSGILADVSWSALPGTKIEGQEVQSILGKKALLYMKKEATEALLKTIVSPQILHIATHGFFLPNLTSKDRPNRRTVRLKTKKKAQIPIPRARGDLSSLLRAGIVLAGVANQSSGSNEDGIMTAKEFGGMNLRGTQLVTLSACETGVGGIKNGQGVFGLRRAIAMAGAKSSVMSLWKVSDEGTQHLMSEFYRQLRNGNGRRDSLRNIQLKMLKSSRFSHPYFWASFTLNGEWESLSND